MRSSNGVPSAGHRVLRMRETIVDHVGPEECALRSRASTPAMAVLQREAALDPVLYPVIDTWITGHASGALGDPQPTPQLRVWHRFPSCCWHDLRSATTQELAGMGLVIVGNLCRGVATKQISTHADAKLVLQRAAPAPQLLLPWPGMPTDNPSCSLDLAQLPFQAAMFFHDEDGQFKHRVDRLALMNRIGILWVPYLRMLLRAN